MKKDWALYLNKLESPLPKDALCQVWLKLVQWFRWWRFLICQCTFAILQLSPFWKRAVSFIWTNLVKWFLRRRFFFNFVNVFLLFRNYLPWKRAGLFIWTIPFTQRWFVLSLVKLTQWFWRRRWKCEKLMTTTTTQMQTTTTMENRQILIRKAHPSLRLTWAKNQECAIGNSFIGLTYHTWSALFGCQGKIERNRCSHGCCRINSEVEKYCLKRKADALVNVFVSQISKQNFSILEVILQHMKTRVLFQCQALNLI